MTNQELIEYQGRSDFHTKTLLLHDEVLTELSRGAQTQNEAYQTLSLKISRLVSVIEKLEAKLEAKLEQKE